MYALVDYTENVMNSPWQKTLTVTRSFEWKESNLGMQTLGLFSPKFKLQ